MKFNALLLNASSERAVANLHITQKYYFECRRPFIVYRIGDLGVATHSNPIASKAYDIYRKKVEDTIIRSLKPDEVINISLSEQLPNCNLSVMQNNALRNGALSTLSGFIRCSDEEDIDSHWNKPFKDLLLIGKKLFCFFLDQFENGLEEISLFNGRFNEDSAVILAAKHSQKNYRVFDIKDHMTLTYYEFYNMSLHNNEENCKRAKSFYVKSPTTGRQVSDKFMDAKFNNKPTNVKVYTGTQNKSYNKTGSILISIFASSDDEYRFLGQEWNGKIVNQIDEIKKLIEPVKDKLEFQVCVKLHPNMKSLNIEKLEQYRSLNSKNVEILMHDTKINTYDVLKKSDFVVVFMSNIGVEANYMRKKVIGIGGNPYSFLPILNQYYDGSTAIEAILSDRVKLKSKRASLIWLNYLWKYSDKNHGIIFDEKLNFGRFKEPIKIFPLWKVMILYLKIKIIYLRIRSRNFRL